MQTQTTLDVVLAHTHTHRHTQKKRVPNNNWTQQVNTLSEGVQHEKKRAVNLSKGIGINFLSVFSFVVSQETSNDNRLFVDEALNFWIEKRFLSNVRRSMPLWWLTKTKRSMKFRTKEKPTARGKCRKTSRIILPASTSIKSPPQ